MFIFGDFGVKWSPSRISSTNGVVCVWSRDDGDLEFVLPKEDAGLNLKLCYFIDL